MSSAFSTSMYQLWHKMAPSDVRGYPPKPPMTDSHQKEVGALRPGNNLCEKVDMRGMIIALGSRKGPNLGALLPCARSLA